jgi:hypothetical protein
MFLRQLLKQSIQALSLACFEHNCSDSGAIRVDTKSENLSHWRDSFPRHQALGELFAASQICRDK